MTVRVNHCLACGGAVDESIAGGECVRCLMQLGIDTSIAATTAHARGTVRGVDEIDALLPDFDVSSLLGAGGMGGVYKAWQKHLERFVAIKVPPRSFIEDKQPLERFVRESKALAKLHHPNVVTIFDAGTTSEFPYLVMELVEGMDLGDYVRSNGPVDANTAMAWMIQAADGLQFAHQKGIIHRDIKPNNLLLDEAGTVKILDLGLAKFDRDLYAEREAGPLTDTGSLMGTVDFIAPELADGTRAADARTDIYALGCTLYYLLTGEILFGGKTVVQTFMAHREEAIPSLQDGQPGIPPELDALFQRMVAKSPSDRPASMSEVAAELKAIARSSGDSASRAVVSPATTSPAAEISPTIALKPQATMRSRAGLWLAAALAAFGIGFVIYRVQTNRGTIVVKIDEGLSRKVDIVLRNGGIQLSPRDGGETQSLAPGKTARVDVGTWRIEPADGLRLSARDQHGVEVDTDRFTIRRNDRIVVDVTLEPPAGEATAVKPAPTAEVNTKTEVNERKPRWEVDPEGGPLKIYAEHIVHPLIYTIREIQVTPDAKRVHLFGTGGHATLDLARMLNLEPQQRCRIKKWDNPYLKGFYSADGKKLFGLFRSEGEAVSVVRLDARTGRLVEVISETPSRYFTHSRDAAKFAFVGPTSKTIFVMETLTGKTLHRLNVEQRDIRDLQFSPSGDQLACVMNATTKVWNLVTGEEQQIATDMSIARYTPDGRELVLGGALGRILRWDLATAQPLNSFRLDGPERQFVDEIYIMRDAKHALITRKVRTILLVDLTDGEVHAELTPVSQQSVMETSTVTMTPDEQYALTGGWGDHECRLWRIPPLD